MCWKLTIGDSFSWIQDFVLSVSCFNGYGTKLSQLLLELSGDVELNPVPLNGDEDISEYRLWPDPLYHLM